MSDRTALLDTYRRLREASLQLNNRLVMQIPKAVLTASAKRLGLLSPDPGRRGEDVLVLDSEYELSVLMDYSLHHGREGGQTVIERALADDPPPAGSDELRLLQAMQAPRYSVFAVEQVAPGIGVQVRDLLRDEPLFLVDIGFSATASPGLLLAGNVISLPELSMTTGAMLPVDQTIGKDLRQQLPGRFSTATVEQFRQLSAHDRAELAGFVTRVCLAGGAASRVEARDAKSSLGPPRAHRSGPPAARRHPRHAPCPCGSGKKYKRCCGRF